MSNVKTPKTPKIVESLRANMQALATSHVNASTEHAALAEQSGDRDESKKAKYHATHGAYGARVAGMTDAALKIAASYGLTAEVINAASREAKKRLIAICEGIATNAKPRDNAADAALAYLFANDGKAESFTLENVRKQMNHETTAQAGYMRTFLSLLGAARKEKGAFVMVWDAPVVNALRAIYTFPAAPAHTDSPAI